MEQYKVQRIAFSGLVMAMYIVIMLGTRSLAFDQYQIRIATALYGLSAFFPFLLLPLALANCLSNMLLGGMGLLDTLGGFVAGALTCSAIIWGKEKVGLGLAVGLSVSLIPGLLVPLWLSYILDLPYLVVMPTVLLGQTACGVLSSFLMKTLQRDLEQGEYL